MEASLNSLLGVLERERQDKTGSDVYLNVYDMVWVNNYTSVFGVGAFHTGLQVYNREYAYGGHPYSYTGVYDVVPRGAAEVAAPGITFRESIHIGHTHITRSEITELVLAVGREYNGNDYHIFNKNCNHFSDVLARRLTGTGVPSWINRLAYLSSWLPLLLSCLPPSWITPGGRETEDNERPQLYTTHSSYIAGHGNAN